MCGIAICISKDTGVKQDFSNRSLALLKHRGPNGHGVWSDENVTLVHTRLAIIDLSTAGHQPMISSNGRYVITYNGEIYNHLDLRKRFLADVRFKGHSDTETILALYDRMGEQMLEYMVGMWAFGIWDTQKKQLFVSRDRYGQKPLYYTTISGSIFFSSEIKPLLQQGADNEVNLLAVSEYLGLGNYGHLFDQTFYQNIHQLLPGNCATFDHTGNLESSRSYWKIDEVPYKDRVPFDDVRRDQFRDLVMQAVESQLLSDVPVGATLSGGLDSSIIVSCIAALGKKKFPVFTAQFSGTVNDETRFVKAIEKKWGDALQVIYTPVEELSLKNSLEEVIRQQEEPFGDPSIMAHGFLVRAAKKAGVPVLLGGQGGDEISLGYPWMYERAFAYALRSGDISAFLKFIRGSHLRLKTITRLMLAAAAPGSEHQLRMRARLHAKRNLSKSLRLKSPERSFGNVSRFNDIYLESVKTVGIPHLCQYDDRSTMHESIEGRMPFLDHRLLEFVSNLRPDAFYQRDFSKVIFRKAFGDLLPVEITQRKDKVGFFTPVAELVSKDKDWILSKLQVSSMSEWISSTKLSMLMDRLKKGELDTHQATEVFRLLLVNLWRQR